jgi:hypothetical protein
MSVRFSLRFEDRSMCRLLGVAMCEEPGCENVVAIIVVIYVHQSVCLTARDPTVDLHHGSRDCSTRVRVVRIVQRKRQGRLQDDHIHEHTIKRFSTNHTANMVLKLRLARPATPGGSRRHAPRYNIVLAHAR